VSHAQQRLWFLERLHPGSPAYNVPVALRTRGAVDAAVLARALNAIVARHEALRTTFVERDGEPCAIVHETLNLDVPRIDISTLDATARAAEIARLAAADATGLFDLARGPLLRLCIVDAGDDGAIVLFCIHHIVADARSLRVFLHELKTLYRAFADDRESPLAPLSIQYADYAAWQRRRLDGELYARQADYWKDKLADAPAATALPYDRSRRPAAGANGAHASIALPARVREGIGRLAADTGSTAFMVCLAGFKALLARYGDASDIIVGTPVENRGREQLEPLIGFFVNTLALRTDLSGDPSFRDIVAAVRASALDAFDHQDLPFEKVVEEVGVAREFGETPLIRCMFSFASESGAADDGPRFLETATETPTVAKFDLTVVAVEHDNGLRLDLQYRSDLFDRATIDRLVGHYARLLEGALDKPDTVLSALPLASDAERETVLRWGEGAPAPRARDVCARFEAHAARDPHAIALVDGARRVSYGELDHAANRVAHALRRQGVGRGALVALAMERSVDMAIGMLAALKAGGAYLPLDTASPPQRLAFVLDDAKAAFVLTRAADEVDLDGTIVPRIALDTLDADLPTSAPERDVAPEDTVYVIYTSGSTGRPKGVEVPQRALANVVDWHVRTLAVAAGDACSQLAGAAFDAAQLEWWGALAAGATLHIVDDATRASPRALIAWLATHGIAVAFMPTPLAHAALDERWPAATRLRALFVGGDALHRTPSAALPFTLYNDYGPTEAAVVTTCAAFAPSDAAADITIGRPIDGAVVRVLDAAGNPAPIGVIGELCIGGAGVARGYRNHPELTAARFGIDPFDAAGAARLYRTGDRARWRGDGTLDFAGRSDDQVKIRGYRIELGEVQAALLAQPGVRQAAVVARGEGIERRLDAYVAAAPGASLDHEQVLAGARRVLPSYMVPAALRVLDQLPYTRNGKLDLAALRATQPSFDAEPYVEPATPTQRLVAQTWADVLGDALGGRAVGANDNFFRLGGHSLLATRVVSRLSAALGAELPLQALFEAGSVAALADGIDARRWNDQMSVAPPVLPQLRSGDDTDTFVQSHAQQRLWFLQQLDPASAAYNVHSLHALRGALDPAALQRSLDAMVERHEILRTRFAMEPNGRLVQIVDRRRTIGIALTNLESLPADVAREKARALVDADMDLPFDLQQGPLLRVHLLRFGPHQHALVVGMHHIVTDAWSMEVFLREFSQLYTGYARGEPAAFDPLPVQYADFATWQEDWMNFGVLEELLFYWQERLRDAPPELALVTDRPKNLKQTPSGGVVTFGLDASTLAAVKAFAHRAGATPFMVLLAGFKALLSRYSDQHDIVLGVPVANRTRQELEPLVGFFVNTLVMRTDLSGDPSFDEAVGRVRDTAIGAFAHQNLPLERLIERLGHERRWQRSPLFRSMFVLQNAPHSPLRLDGIDIEPMALTPKASKFDLSLFLQEQQDRLLGLFEYSTDLLDRATIERMVEHYRLLLDAALLSPRTRLSALPLVTVDEREQLIAWGRGATPAAEADDVVGRFRAHAARAPQALAIADGARSLTYAELDARTDGLAHALARQGLQPGQVAALALPRSIETAVATLAVLKAGGAFLPLDIANPPERLAYILGDAQVSMVLVREGDTVDLGDAASRVARVAVDAAHEAAPGAVPAHRIAANDLAYVIYTSGSTGRPKGVEVEHGALANLVAWQTATFDIDAADRCSQLAGAAFDATQLEWWAALANGGSLHIADDATRASPTALVAWLAASRITLAFMPTPLAEATFDEAWPADTALRALLTGGDVLHRAPPAGLPFALYNAYGPTEATVVTTCAPIAPAGDNDARPTIGRPIDGMLVRVLDDAGQPVPVGIVGELYVGGAGIARGYRNQPALTAERFVADPLDAHARTRLYRTGDRVRYRQDGSLDFVGRADDQVKIRGFRIELGEVESALRRLEGVRQAAVVAREDVPGDKRLVGYVVVDADAGAIDGDTLAASLRMQLPDYMVPAAIVTLDELPLAPSGKIDRRALPKPAIERYVDTDDLVPPRDDVERELVAMWEALLDYKPAGINHNFFRYGGHSLNALSLRSRIEAMWGVRIDLVALFEDGTVAHLARHVRALRDAAGTADAPAAAAAPPASGPSWFARLMQRLGIFRNVARAPRFKPEEIARTVSVIEPGGTGPALFLAHSPGGGVLCYAELARQLKGQMPLYGLRAADAARAPGTVEALAGLYVQAMRSVQPQGPYALCGWSLGGVVAFEMARQLREAGEDVAGVTLLDSYPFDPRLDSADLDDNQVLDAFVRDLVLSSGGKLAPDWFLDADTGTDADPRMQALAALQSLGVLPADFSREEFAARIAAYRAAYKAWTRYAPKPYAGRVDLAMAMDSLDLLKRNPTQAWGAYAAGGMAIDVVPGDHYSILRTPAARQIGDGLAASHRARATPRAAAAE
jgi:amino acid adenylation domain-containing protein